MTLPAPNTATRSQTRRLSEIANEAPPQTVLAATRLLGAAIERNELDQFFAHVLNALARIAETSDPQSLAAGSGYDALVRLLDRPEVLAELEPRNPLAPARLRGLALKRQILAAEGGVVSAQVMGEALGLSRQAVDKRRKRGTLLGLSLGRRGYAYPVWQIELDGLAEVLVELSELDPWTQAAFMLTPNRWLSGMSPLEALRTGDREGVLQAARLYGEQVAA